MHRNRVAVLLVLLLSLLTSLVAPAPVLAAEETAPSLAYSTMTFPKSVTAGDTVRFSVPVNVLKPEIGLCCGRMLITGPSKQRLFVDLTRNGNTLEGSLKLSANAPAGTYAVTELGLRDNDGKYLILKNGEKGFSQTFTVNAKGAPDTKGPTLNSISLPEKVANGDEIVVTAKATDDLSGVGEIYVTVQPKSVGDPGWSFVLMLHPTGKANEFSGSMVADAGAYIYGEGFISKVQLYDAAGNGTFLEGKALEGKENRTVMTVTRSTVPKEMLTSPNLNVIHPGPLAYWYWPGEDYEYVYNLLVQASKDPQAVRERVMGDLALLQTAIEGLRKELYTDPTTGLTISPMATSGKWYILSRASLVRLELLAELDRRAGTAHEKRPEFDEDYLDWLFQFFGEGARWLPMDETLPEWWTQMPLAVLKQLARSPEALKVMKTPALESEGYQQYDFMDRDVLYFLPVSSTNAPRLVTGTRSFSVYYDIRRTVTGVVQDLFYEIGRHFGQAYLSAYDARDRVSKWNGYLQLRGNQTWPDKIGWLGSATNNLADDFAVSFLPGKLGQQYVSAQSYQRLRDNPTMAEAFRSFVTTSLTQSTVMPKWSIANNRLEVGTAESRVVTVEGAAQNSVDFLGYYWAKSISPQSIPVSTVQGKAIFTYQVTEMGRAAEFALQAKTSTGRTSFRNSLYVRVPVLLDALPASTNSSPLTISGKAAPGAKVTVGATTATADNQGKFSLKVNLNPGENLIRLSTGEKLGSTVRVLYSPKTSKVPLKVNVGGTVRTEALQGVLETAPYAMVSIGSDSGQANYKGEFTYYVPLEEGTNRIQVKVTDTFGNSASWSGLVVRDTKAPSLLVSLPMRTNLSSYSLTGKTEAGALLTVNDQELPVKADGSFSLDLKLAPNKPQEFTLVAVDSAGNQAEQVRSVAYDPTVPLYVAGTSVDVKGQVEPGLALTYLGKPVTVDKDGKFTLTVSLRPLEENRVILQATKGGEAVGFLEYRVTSAVAVDSVKMQSNGRLRISGRAAKGYQVSVDFAVAEPAADGTWSLEVAPGGRTQLQLNVSGPSGSQSLTVDVPK